MLSEILKSVNNEKRSRYALDDSHVLRLSKRKIGLRILVLGKVSYNERQSPLLNNV